MKKLFFLLIVIATSTKGFSQTISAEEAEKHIGDNVTVCGKIFGGRFFETSTNAPTLLNVGAAYPASPFTIVIPGSVRIKMGFAPEQKWRDKNVCVTGKIVLHKNKPEIEITDESQIVEK